MADYIPNAICLSRKIVAKLPKDWRCPVCERDLSEIASWSSRLNSLKYVVCEHHDHGALKRFPNIFICEHCNHVDGEVKRKRRTHHITKTVWSFSPAEIRSVIEIKPNRKHKIDLDKAEVLALKLMHEHY